MMEPVIIPNIDLRAVYNSICNVKALERILADVELLSFRCLIDYLPADAFFKARQKTVSRFLFEIRSAVYIRKPYVISADETHTLELINNNTLRVLYRTNLSDVPLIKQASFEVSMTYVQTSAGVECSFKHESTQSSYYYGTVFVKSGSLKQAKRKFDCIMLILNELSASRQCSKLQSRTEPCRRVCDEVSAEDWHKHPIVREYAIYEQKHTFSAGGASGNHPSYVDHLKLAVVYYLLFKLLNVIENCIKNAL